MFDVNSKTIKGINIRNVKDCMCKSESSELKPTKIPGGEIKLEFFCILTGIQTNRIGLRPNRIIVKVDLTRHLPQH